MTFQVTEQQQGLLAWLREMDDQHVSTGLLALAFEAGWAACEAKLRGLPAHDLLVHTHVHVSHGVRHEHEHAHLRTEAGSGPDPG
jgi:hypothetical protein